MNMSDIKYTIRNMCKEDVPKALDVWKETGMQEGKYSLYTWLEVDPEAFKIAVTDEGDVIGVCSAAIQHEDLAFMGLYCVRKEYRGIGIGFKLWNACLQHIAHRNACLYAVIDMAEKYQSRGGFPITDSKWSFNSRRCKSSFNADKLCDTPIYGVEVIPFEESHLTLMCDYDKKLIGYDRHLAIKLTCKEPETNTYVAIKNSQCVGFGMIKMSCQGNTLVGPLYADDKEIAEVLLKKLIISLPQDNGLALITFSNNDATNEFATRMGLPPITHEIPFLYRKKNLDIDPSKVYAVFDTNFSPY